MYITTSVKLLTILKLIIFIIIVAFIYIKIKEIKKYGLNKSKNINYLLKRNTKTLIKNKYSKFNIHNKDENIKVYNFNGEDTVRYPNGDIYKGQIKNGLREGLGTCYFYNKDMYEGIWKNDKMECVGKYVFADKSFYSGDFKNGCKEGIGVYQCSDYKYIGQYYADRKGRVGTFHLPNDEYLKVIIENGTIVEGTYLRDGKKEEYIYNIDLDNEREVIKNIKSYFIKDVSNI
ncbi:hypothetical protein [Terrisporobacter sp.]|uniref:hypothetical protein n=1 Tax=Terrisporobacter sp. TaxID=1965305 RepID=UPI00262D14E8|nr:hypothetical protein [Terrisporobacter sp.]